MLTKVSILTPSYNQAEWLGDNLLSVSNQTYPHIEHVVCDGGSIDASVRILSQATHDLIWSSEPDRGQSHALNKALERSSGEVIGWIISDDAYVDRRAVEAAVETFRTNPDVGVVYGHGLLVNESNRVLQVVWTPPYNAALLRRQTFFVQPSVFFRRSLVESLFVREDLHFVMDRDLWMRLREVTRFKRIDLFVGMDRQQPARKSLDDRMRQETRDYDGALGIDHTSRPGALIRKVTKAGLRWAGIPKAYCLPDMLDPAIDLDLMDSRRRLVNQGFIPRSRM